ncbi:MAG: hydroxymethylglutaryl-CoA lyase [Xanthobacteraceae bacterium]|nr:hydroxymethylglutaryl-CoA lyase [Xanthobacteraceae bacterium]PWB66838.1 MAG: hydroxymethylglutaryl-CoA lyase [Bradyrhizobiaceae bacterium]
MGQRAEVREVGLRDGLQLVKTVLSTEQKLEWCRRAAAAGMPEVEVTSFVPAKVVPQFVDADAVARGAVAMGGFVAAALVPNLRGAERAFETGVAKVNYVLSASEAHNLANVRRSTQESLDDFVRIVARRDEVAKGRSLIGAGIATAFGCTISGVVSEKRVVAIAEQLARAGADEIIVADTVGYGNPGQVERLVRAVVRAVGDVPVACHFHDTRGLGLANVVAALAAGVHRFDASLGGLGGCPFAPGATGNIDTEDCVFLLESLGYDTGIDIEALVKLRETVEGWLPGERFSGAIARAGLPKTFRAPVETAA